MSERHFACGKPLATSEDWERIPEGEGAHLCWEPERCETDMTPRELYERALSEVRAALSVTMYEGMSAEDELRVRRQQVARVMAIVGGGA